MTSETDISSEPTNSLKNESFNVLDLFAGAGGISTGFELAGFNIKVANEINSPACKTHIHNHPNCIMIPGNIQNTDIKQEIIKQSIKENVNIITGGPPCKGYSNSGDKDPRDNRSKLYLDYFEIVKDVNPEIFIIENVPGISTMKIFPNLSDEQKEEYKSELELFDTLQDLKNLNGAKKDKDGKKTDLTSIQQKQYEKVKKKLTDKLCINALNDIINISNKLGYDIIHKKVLNSQNYNVPQKRKRMIIMGVKREKLINFNLENFLIQTSDVIITVKDAIDDLKDIAEDVRFSHTFRKYKDLTIPQKIIKCAYGESYTGNYSESNNKCHPDKPSNTVKENHGAVMTHYEKGRHLSARELARLQTFPDTFIFPCTKGSTLEQIGNAVPCQLAKAIAESIKPILVSDLEFIAK